MSRSGAPKASEAKDDDRSEQVAKAVTHDLPGEDVFPEGVALYEEDNSFFVSGAKSGTIYRGNLSTGSIEPFVFGDDREPFTTIGLYVDAKGRLWVAGGASGKLFVFDARSAEPQQTFTTPPSSDTFLNDLVSGPSGTVYVTDSLRTMLFRVLPGADEVEPWLELSGTAFESRARGSDANGIVVTPDEAHLVVVKTGTGQLFRVHTQSGEVREIDLGGEDVVNGDGLVLERHTLYVVRTSDRQVDVIDMSEDYLSGRKVSRLSDPSLEFPTTAAKLGDELLVVNSQFDVMDDGKPRLPFRVTRLRIQ